MLPDVKASLPSSGQHVSADLHAIERACVPGIEADCRHVPFTSIMVRPVPAIYVLLPWPNLPARRMVRYHINHSLAHRFQTQRLRGCIPHKDSSSTSDHSQASLPISAMMVSHLVAALCRTRSIGTHCSVHL